jgi:hypothetical protein
MQNERDTLLSLNVSNIKYTAIWGNICSESKGRYFTHNLLDATHVISRLSDLCLFACSKKNSHSSYCCLSKFETTSLLLFVYIKRVSIHMSRGMFRQETEEMEKMTSWLDSILFAINMKRMANQTWDGRDI